MNEARHGHHSHGGHGHDGDRPYWTRAHRDWRFWVAAILMLMAMSVYVLSEDLAWRPRGQAAPSSPGTGGGQRSSTGRTGPDRQP